MAFMARRGKQTKTRTLRLSDGGTFRVGPGTVSIPVSTIPLDPPAVVLHVNRSCGALELVPDTNGTTPPPQRLDAARVVALVEQINADRHMSAMRGGRAEPPVELPPTFKSTARHVQAWQQRFPFMVHDNAVGYPGKVDTNETLWVHRETGKAMLETITPPKDGGLVSHVGWEELSPRRAAAWLTSNAYTFMPATLHRRRAEHEPPPQRRKAGK